MNSLRALAKITQYGLLAVYLCAPNFIAAQTRADAEKDPVLKAMLTELDRNMTQLQLPGFAKPFYIQYRIEDVEDYQTRAVFGASEGSQHSRQRIARVTVRVGDHKTDSSGGRGDGVLVLTSLSEDPIAIRSALWQATDQAYKNALTAYAQKQAALKQAQTPPQADDFSHEKPVISLAEPATLKLDQAAWAARVAKDSGIYRTDDALKADRDSIQSDAAAFHARAVTTRLVTNEGAIVRKSASEFEETFAVGTQADDGMRLERSYATEGVALADLDSEDKFSKHEVALIQSLAELRKAPLVEEEYHGPLLLSSDAGADTLRNLLAGAVVATRPRLGTEARTNGAFASSYKARVLPDTFDVVDDPTLKTFNGVDLLGAYAIDDDGVPAQTVNLITAGRLENYLIGREPVKDFPQSNGHGRAGAATAPRPTISVLKITAKDGMSADELNAKLIQMAKDGGLKSVYYVATMAGNAPRLLYRVNTDGTRQLVRGAVLADLDQRALRSSIEAAGKDLFIANYFGDVPQTVLAPALLLDDATVKRANEKNDKLPFYPAPGE
jgi:predicted Zn-dependent protease